MHKYYYSTKRLIVYFTWSNDKLCCTIYRKGNEQVLQSYSIKRPGFKRLNNRTKIAVARQLLKAVRNRQNQALNVVLNTKG